MKPWPYLCMCLGFPLWIVFGMQHIPLLYTAICFGYFSLNTNDQKRSELKYHRTRQCQSSWCLLSDYCVCLCSMYSFVCVYVSVIRNCTYEKYPVSLHLCLGLEAWVTTWCRLQNRGYEWVLPPAKSCQSDGERVQRSIWAESCYKWAGHLCRETNGRTERTTDKERGQAESSE